MCLDSRESFSIVLQGLFSCYFVFRAENIFVAELIKKFNSPRLKDFIVSMEIDWVDFEKKLKIFNRFFCLAIQQAQSGHDVQVLYPVNNQLFVFYHECNSFFYF